MYKGLFEFVIRTVMAIATFIASRYGYSQYNDPIMKFVYFCGEIMGGIAFFLAFAVLYCFLTGRYN
jgi:hypothetical protein